jgi:hypothetical protein
MLEFTEALQHEIKQLKLDAQNTIMSGRVTNMEQYRHLMGRIEGYVFVEGVIQHLLKQNPID